jgi:hypothetical protein
MVRAPQENRSLDAPSLGSTSLLLALWSTDAVSLAPVGKRVAPPPTEKVT